MEGQQPITPGNPPYALHPGTRAVELVHLFDKMRAIRAFFFDIDGVFTDNSLLVTEAGDILRTMNVRDGQAVKWAIRQGFQMVVITGGRSKGVYNRLTTLGVQEIYSGVEDKKSVFQAVLQRLDLRTESVCYMGDDLPDLPVMRKAGLACAPADAVPEVLAVADYISPLKGGQGCVRDLLEKVLKMQDKWVEY